ncbi:MAG: hypothetical protein JO083_08395 [Candidatus Eremiobacteraeota bacterium]|nr:hypothetical protein [Candidatus Eremiobacteraeota bacterium]
MSLLTLGADAAKRKSALRTARHPGGPTSPPQPPAPEQTPLDALVLFLPAETVAIFVTVATALFAAFPDHQHTAALSWYVFCLVLTPIFTWIGFATQWRKDHAGAYPPATTTPWFRLVASTVAFLPWGLAVAPAVGSELLCHVAPVSGSGSATATCNAEAISGVAVLIVGAILTALDGLIDYSPKE